jgi:hypothetical protein
MTKTTWTSARLQRLFQRYNRAYWDERIPLYTVLSRKPRGGFIGYCHRGPRRIEIDVAAHATDAEIRATLLHEMAHAADRSGNPRAHGSGFWRQIEHLLSRGAPIALHETEMPGVAFAVSSIPAAFKLARKAVGVAIRRKLRPYRHRRVQVVTDAQILQEFTDAGMEGIPWELTLANVTERHGLFNIDGKSVNQRTAQLIARGRQAHANGRAFLQQNRRVGTAFANSRRRSGRTRMLIPQ